MSKTIEIKCPYCKYEEVLCFGEKQSFHIVDIDTLIQTTESLKQAQDLLILKEKYNAKIKGIPEMKLYECPNCKTLHSELHYELVLNNNKSISTKHACPKCNTTLVKIKKNDKIDLRNYNCRKCGKRLG